MPIYVVTEHTWHGTNMVGEHVYEIRALTFLDAVVCLKHRLQTAPHLRNHRVTIETYPDKMHFQIAAQGTNFPVSGSLADRPLMLLTDDGQMEEASDVVKA